MGGTQKAVETAVPLNFENKISRWLSKGKMVGLGADTSNREVYGSPVIDSLFGEYAALCLKGDGEGRVILLYGFYGTGKTCALSSLVRGPSTGSWCPTKSMFVGVKECDCGDAWFQELCSKLEYTGSDLAEDLIRIANLEKSRIEKMKATVKSMFNHADASAQVNTEITRDVSITIQGFCDPEKPFDDKKLPVIAIDNVDFNYDKDGKHTQFFNFARGLKDLAYASGVVVVFGTNNIEICKALAVLNGFSKIAPAEISASYKKEDIDAANEESKVTEAGVSHPRTIALRGTLGWTKDEIQKCLLFKFPELQESTAGGIGSRHAPTGNIRGALTDGFNISCTMSPRKIGSLNSPPASKSTDTSMDRPETKSTGTSMDSSLSLATKSTGTSTSMDAGEADRSSLLDAGSYSRDEDDDSVHSTGSARLQLILNEKMGKFGLE